MLRLAGWHQSRAVATGTYAEVLEAEGYPVFPCVIDFLQQFGGLRLPFPAKAYFWKRSCCNFDPCKAIETIPENASFVEQQFAPRVRSSLCPIGMVEKHLDILYMASDGRVFSRFGDGLVFLGNSGHEAIEDLCAGEGDIINVPPTS
jgi:hypothetical protein